MGRFCPRCGAEAAPDEKVCPACGAALSELDSKLAKSKLLTGTAFIEKGKTWAAPQKKGMRMDFVMLAILLLFAFVAVAGLLGIHLFEGYSQNAADGALPEAANRIQEEQDTTTETNDIDTHEQKRELSQEEQLLLKDFISCFEQKVGEILTQDWERDGIKGAYALEGYVLENSALWKGLDAQTGAWNGANKEGLPEFTSYQIKSYTTQWDGDVLVLRAQEVLEGVAPSGEEVSFAFEDTYMLERHSENFFCFDSRCDLLLDKLDTYYSDASAENLEFWIIAGATRFYTEEELERASEFESSALRNGMYAISGKIFTQNRQIQDYFKQFGWYRPDTEDDEIVRGRMNEYQIQNITRILEVERGKKG